MATAASYDPQRLTGRLRHRNPQVHAPTQAGLDAMGTLRPWSVVIPTYRRLDELVRCVEELLEVPLPQGSEVLAVEQFEPEKTEAELAKRFGTEVVRTIGTHPPSASRGRNVGMAQARHDLIAFLDDDCFFSADYFRHAQWYFDNHPQIAALSASVSDPMFSGRSWRMRLLSRLGMAPVDGRRYGGYQLLDAMVDAPSCVEAGGAGGLAIRRKVREWGLRFDETYRRWSLTEDMCFSGEIAAKWSHGYCKVPQPVHHRRSEQERVSEESKQRAAVIYRLATCASLDETHAVRWNDWLWHLFVNLLRSRSLLGSPRLLLALWRATLFALRHRRLLCERELVLGAYVLDGALVRRGDNGAQSG